MIRNRLYYGLKPLLPAFVRLRIRRWFALGKRRKVGDVWPILPGSGRPPDGWPGWPEGKKFAFVLTHDVEGPAGMAHCRQLMALEAKWGFRSSFNFIPEGSYRVPRELRDELTRQGFEVGVHDLRHDGKLFRSRKIVSENAARINRYLEEWGAVGFRAGFMLHELDWLADLAIQYDLSRFDTDPFEPQPDGVNTIFPFWHENPSGYGYVELPYTLPQDSTLFLLLEEQTIDIWRRKLEWIVGQGGMALLNVHPDYAQFPGEAPRHSTYPLKFYEDFLRHVSEQYAGLYWNALPRQAAAWYRKAMAIAPPASAPLRAKAAVVPGGTPPGEGRRLRGRAAVVLYSYYESDARPRNEAEALARAGMEVEVICLKQKGEAGRDRIGGVNIRRVPLRRRRGGLGTYIFQYFWFTAASFGILAWRSLRNRYQLVHVHNMPDPLVFAALIPKLRGAKVILDLHDPVPELFESLFHLPASHLAHRLLVWQERRSIAFADLVLTPNEAFRRVFTGRSCPPEKIRVAMNAPDPELFHPPVPGAAAGGDKGGKTFTLVYHGLLVERHGLDTAVKALAGLRHRLPEIRLELYGEETPYMHSIMRLVEEKGLKDAVTYHGFVPLREIPAAIARADLGLVPNRRNCFTEINMPTRIFECLAMGKPVLVPRTAGIRDYFNDDNMFFFEPDDVEDMARKIEWAYSNPEALRSLAERGRAVYEAHAWPKQREALLDIVEGLLRPAAPARQRAKRICMVCYSYYETDNRVIRYAEELAQRGDEVEVLALRRDKEQPVEESINQVRVIRIQDRFSKREQSKASYLLPVVRFWLQASWRLAWRQLTSPYDLIHVHNMPDFLVFAAWFNKLCGTKVILDIHDIMPEFYASKFDMAAHRSAVRWLKEVERAAVHFSDHVIISNDIWREKFAARNRAGGKCSVFINNVNSKTFQRKEGRRQDGKFIIMFPGGLQWHQGVDIALRAFQKVSGRVPEAEFHIYGDGSVKGNLVNLAQSLNLNRKVRFFEPVPLRQIARIMAQADLGVVPKRADSFGNEAYSTKIMEFMSLGVPVIVSSTKIDRYYFNDSVVRFFESGNEEALAEAMLELMCNARKRQEMVARALEFVEQNSWDKHKARYLGLVDDLCAWKREPEQPKPDAGTIAHAA